MSEKILIVEIPDFRQPRTQADLDALKAEDVGRLDDACLAAAFARLVARLPEPFIYDEVDGKWYYGPDDGWDEVREFGFSVATVDAIRERGWEWKVWRQWATCWARVGPWKTDESKRCHAVFADPARALMSAAVLAAIAERDAG